MVLDHLADYWFGLVYWINCLDWFDDIVNGPGLVKDIWTTGLDQWFIYVSGYSSKRAEMRASFIEFSSTNSQNRNFSSTTTLLWPL